MKVDAMARAVPGDEEGVIARCRRGDEAAWHILVERYQHMVYTICRRVAGPDAEDAAQETFLRVFRKLHSYRGGAGKKFSTWLYRVAYNCACDVARARGPAAAPIDDEFDWPGDGPGPDDRAAEGDYALLARRALARLAPKYRQALELFYLMDNSYDDVAAVMGIPVGTAKSYIHRGKAALLRELYRMGVAAEVAEGL